MTACGELREIGSMRSFWKGIRWKSFRGGDLEGVEGTGGLRRFWESEQILRSLRFVGCEEIWGGGDIEES